jgi:hypothetical protein
MLLNLNARIRPGLQRPLGIPISVDSPWVSKDHASFKLKPTVEQSAVELKVFEIDKKKSFTRIPYLAFKSEIEASRMCSAIKFDYGEKKCIEAKGDKVFWLKENRPTFTIEKAALLGQQKEEIVNLKYIPSIRISDILPQNDLYQLVGMSAFEGSEFVWNFAYGANMSSFKLTQTRNIQPLESIPAILPGYRLAFNHRGGMGNVMEQEEDEEGSSQLPVHGVLHKLKLIDYLALLEMEHEYLPIEILAHSYDEREIPAVVLKSPKERCIEEGLPVPQRYMNLLIDGAQEFKLHPRYQNFLKSRATIQSSNRNYPYYTSASDKQYKLFAWPKVSFSEKV